MKTTLNILSQPAAASPLPAMAAVTTVTVPPGQGVASSSGLDLPLFLDVLRDVLPEQLLVQGEVTEAAGPAEATGLAVEATDEPGETQADATAATTTALAAPAWLPGSADAALAKLPWAEGVSPDPAPTSPGMTAAVDTVVPLANGAPARLAAAAQALPLGATAGGAAVGATPVVSEDAQSLPAALQPKKKDAAAPALVESMVEEAASTPAAPALHRVTAGAAGVATAPDTVATLGTTLPSGREPAATLALPGRQPELWQRPLTQALGERLQVQVTQGSERAVIRLDPPMLGRVEIVLRQDAGGLQVQLNATHGEVVRQLHTISDVLRQELSQRQSAAVTVQVSDQLGASADGRQQRQRQDPESADKPGQALASAQDGARFPSFELA